MATLINYYAKTYPELGISTTNPKVLNETLKKNNGYSITHDLKFESISIVSNNKLVPNGVYNYFVPLNYLSETEARELINTDLQDKLPVIVRIYRSWINPSTNKKEEWNHFALIVGKCRDKYVISDPGTNKRFLLDIRESVIINETNKNTFGPINGIRRFKIK